jgi:hypothetical protein
MLFIDPAEARRWRDYIHADPQVKIRFGTKVYLRTAVLVGSPGQLEEFSERSLHRSTRSARERIDEMQCVSARLSAPRRRADQLDSNPVQRRRRSHPIGPLNHQAPGIRRFRGLGLLVAGARYDRVESAGATIRVRLRFVANTPTPIEVSPKRLRPLVADRVTDLKETFAGDHRAGHTQRDKRAA